MAGDFESKFVGDKISKLKFVEQTLNDELFLAGTYDSNNNNVSIWSVKTSENDGDGDTESSIIKISSINHDGDVLGLDCDGNVVATGSSTGSVNILNFNKHNNRLEPINCWENLHKFQYGSQCPCTDVSYDVNLATCGEDGTINILDVTRPVPIRRLESCDSTVLTSVLWVTQYSIAVSNTCGQLKVFDMRQSGSRPTQLFTLSADFNVLNCLEKHPSQHHVLATGTYNGLMGIYDLRQDSVPVTILEGHNASSISDIKFHPRSSDSLFSCGSDGSVWQWNSTNKRDGESSWWFFTDAAKHRVEISELTSIYTQASCMTGFEVNTIDVCNDTLICGTDNAAICVFSDLKLS